MLLELELALDALLELLLAVLELAPLAPPTPVDVEPPVELLLDVAVLALVEEVLLVALALELELDVPASVLPSKASQAATSLCA